MVGNGFMANNHIVFIRLTCGFDTHWHIPDKENKLERRKLHMIVSVQCLNDAKTFGNGYAFWHNGKKVAQCDESDYHETVTELISQGYIIR